MAYAITQTCCNDATCVSVCPVNCIHPTPEEPDFGTTEMLYVDPQTCIDCGACADACPVDAIFPVDRLMGRDTVFAELNQQYYADRPTDNEWSAPRFPRSLPRTPEGPARVAVVGTGPAACYAAESLLRIGASVTMIDRQPVPGGLVRFGVAPDHPSTKKIGDSFASLFQHPRLQMHLNVEVGTHVSHEELAAHHHAVVYGVGAAADNPLGVPGEDLAGSISATAFVAWYNAYPDAHPTVSNTPIDLSAERAVIVGNGNVALDVARILASDPEDLARTDIADHALEALRASNIREVVLIARRGPEQAAFTRPELLALKHLPGVRLVLDSTTVTADDVAAAAPGSKTALFSDVDAEEVDWQSPPPAGKRIVFRFLSSPLELTGDGRVEGIALSRNILEERDGQVAVTATGDRDELPTGLVLRSTGYRGRPLPGLPFDSTTATVPHEAGRVLDSPGGARLDGTYVVGWIKRGPSGGIGANRTCAEETVDSIIDDAAAGALPSPRGSARAFARLVRQRQPQVITRQQALAIDQAERELGAKVGRPRVKLASTEELLAAVKKPLRR
ncbi:FAD-dependent oxidoreductase [Rhodococcus sp. X156]|uniref:FAD-dependent oxidoreductase n=1 Tax=Rhodococcus sp. X156 TaxID=2499145 RepID=UPI000FDA4F8F|nr:FAD-dependent oxidoreductase [Rhodococcus sp. X156]